MIQVTDDLQNGDILSRSLAYDQAGRVTAVTDEEGETTRFEYDGLNRLTKTIDPLGNETVYKYDDRGSLIELRDAEGRTTCFEYDRNGRLTKKIRPLLQETGYEYDAAGNLSALADANGRRIEYAYDAVNRLVQTRFYAAGDHTTPVKTVDFTYDELGRLLTWDDGTASGAYTYDNLGRKTTETVDYGAFSLSYSYTYYANGRKKSFTGPDGAEIGYTYDENNRLAGIHIPGQGYITNAYDSAHWNRPAQTMLPGGGQTDFAYDPLLRLKSIAAEDPGDNTVLNRAYDYSPDGDITDKTTEYGDHAYQYDAVDQLLSADNPEDAGLTDEGYTYDAVYNRLTSAGVTGDWSYNDNNELTGYDNVSYEYDANGNMTQKTVGTEITSYEYTVDNRLAKVWDGEAETGTRMAEYGYDPFGRRLWKEVDGTRTCFLYSDEGLIGEYDAAGNEIKTYGWRPGGLWGTNPLFLKQGGTYYWYVNNYQGTPQKLVMSSGLVVWEARYDSFGQAQVTESGVNSNLRLPGQYFDAETGLHYNWHRYYDPKIGRYLRVDPAEDGINLYAYCLNNPVNYIDPFGLFIRHLCEDKLPSCLRDNRSDAEREAATKAYYNDLKKRLGEAASLGLAYGKAEKAVVVQPAYLILTWPFTSEEEGTRPPLWPPLTPGQGKIEPPTPPPLDSEPAKIDSEPAKNK